MKKEITKRQKELLQVIYAYIKDTGYPPTFEEMRDRLGVSSNQSIIDLLEKLQNTGMIKRGASAARGINILPLGYQALGKRSLVPYEGVASGGVPLETVNVSGEWRQLSPDIAQLQGEIFMLKVSGDSMINAGIDDNDVVLVQSAQEFVSGDIVYAQVGDAATIKRFMVKGKKRHSYLKPENPAHSNILCTDEVKLKGKIISVLKNDQWTLVS